MSHSLCYFFLYFIQSHKLELRKGPLCAEKTHRCVTRECSDVWRAASPDMRREDSCQGTFGHLSIPHPETCPQSNTHLLYKVPAAVAVAPNRSVIFTYLHTTTHDSLVIFPIIPLQQTLNGWGGGRMWLSPAAKVCGLSGRWAAEKLSYDLRNFHIKAMHTGQINKISGLRHSRLCNKS